MAILADLMLRLRANSADLQKGLDQSSKKVKNFEKENQSISKGIKAAWGQIGLAIAGVAGVLKTAEKAINSTQLTGDKFAAMTGGLKEATNAFARSLANLNFDNLIKGLTDAYKAGKAYVEALDDIADRQRSVSISSKETQLAIKKLEADLRNTYLTEDERRAVVEEINRLTTEQFLREQKLAEQSLQAEKDRLKQTYNITDAQVDMMINYIKNYNDLDAVQHSSIATAMKARKAYEKASGAVGAFDEERRVVRTREAYEASLVGLSEQEKAYVELGTVINGVLDEERDQIAKVITGWLDAQIALQEYYNKAARVENKLDGEAEKERAKLLAERKKELEDLMIPVRTDNLNPKPLDTDTLRPMKNATVVEQPDRSTVEQPDLDAATKAWVDYKDGVIGIWGMIESQALTTFNKIKDTAVDVGGMLAGTLTDAVVGLAGAFGNLFAGTEAGFKGVVTAALQSIQQIINALLAQAVAGMIAGESKRGIPGLIAGAIGVSALLALWKSKVPEFATGTNFAPGGLALVGERGPELVNIPRGSAVYNNRLTQSALAGGYGEVRFRIEGTELVGILNKQNKIYASY